MLIRPLSDIPLELVRPSRRLAAGQWLYPRAIIIFMHRFFEMGTNFPPIKYVPNYMCVHTEVKFVLKSSFTCFICSGMVGGVITSYPYLHMYNTRTCIHTLYPYGNKFIETFNESWH